MSIVIILKLISSSSLYANTLVYFLCSVLMGLRFRLLLPFLCYIEHLTRWLFNFYYRAPLVFPVLFGTISRPLPLITVYANFFMSNRACTKITRHAQLYVPRYTICSITVHCCNDTLFHCGWKTRRLLHNSHTTKGWSQHDKTLISIIGPYIF